MGGWGLWGERIWEVGCDKVRGGGWSGLGWGFVERWGVMGGLMRGGEMGTLEGRVGLGKVVGVLYGIIWCYF